MDDQKRHRASPPIASANQIVSSRMNWTQHFWCLIESSDAPAWSVGDARICYVSASNDGVSIPIGNVFQYLNSSI